MSISLELTYIEDHFPKLNEDIIEKMIHYLGIHTIQLDITFITNNQMQVLNKTHLNHDYPTDIITFDLSEGETIFGDVYISVQQAEIQAKDEGHSIETELYTLVIHGLLHLLGFDDLNESDKKIMFEKQNEVLNALCL